MSSPSTLRSIPINECGLAALEFALAAPILLLLLLGGFELSRYLLAHQKLDRTAYTVADVVTQSTTVTNAQLAQILTATTPIMEPFDFFANGVVILSSVYKNGTNPPAVRWQYKGGGSLTRDSRIGTLNGTASLPAGLSLNDRDNLIFAEVYYRYEPVFSAGFLSERDVYKTALFKPRLGALTTPPH